MLTNNRLIETQAQQSFRFYLKINDFPVAYIVNVARPSYTITTAPYKLLNHYFNHPTEIKWNPINFVIKEIFSREVEETISALVVRKLLEGSYDNPDNIDETKLKDLNKADLMKSLGRVAIQALTPEGEIYEEWKLHGAFISDVKPSELSYGAEDLINIGITVIYDWAELIYHKK